MSDVIPTDTLTTYDEIPYPSFSFPETHPDRLALLATLLGLNPAPVTACRVLELGCGAGGNLLPMAYVLPESEFIGVDLAPTAIAYGKRVIDALGLTNVQMHHLDIMAVDESFGQFDYIIAHGVFSWVPDFVREQMLHIAKVNLKPQGVAYISYNAYPGWKVLGTVRDMMLYHVRNTHDPDTRSLEARKLVNFLADVTPRTHLDDPSFQDAFANLVKAYWNHTRSRGDSIFLHDDLEENNQPFYFHEFMARAHKHGLQFLCEAQLSRSVPANLPDEVAGMLRKMSADVIEMEQYMDFLRNATFRRTLLVHEGVEINRTLAPNPLLFERLYIGTKASPKGGDKLSETDIKGPNEVTFEVEETATLGTNHPVSKAAMSLLWQAAPGLMAFPELLTQARTWVYGEGFEPDAERYETDRMTLVSNLLRGYSYNDELVQLRLFNPPAVYTVSEKPKASALSRYQAQQGEDYISNLRHDRVLLNPLHRYLLPYLDGRHTHEMLQALLETLAADGSLQVKKDTEGRSEVTDPEELRKVLHEELLATLQHLADAGLFEG